MMTQHANGHMRGRTIAAWISALVLTVVASASGTAAVYHQFVGKPIESLSVEQERLAYRQDAMEQRHNRLQLDILQRLARIEAMLDRRDQREAR